MNKKYISSYLIIAIFSVSTLISSPLQKVYAFFGANVYQQAINAEYELENPGILTIENVHGSIHITTETDQKKVFVSAIKKSADEKKLPSIHIKGSHKQENKLNHLTLRTCLEKDVQGEVDYSLIVPTGTTLLLNTQQGNISIGQAKGAINVSTHNGSITINKAQNIIKAHTSQGCISITDASDNITATTSNGNINIDGSKKSVIAQTEKGEINMRCAHLPETARITLRTNSGNVKLTLPEKINAAILGQTEKGTLISDAFIDIKPRSTKLDKNAWKQFKKRVEGTLGSGEAEIKVTTARGNIKIAQIKST